MNLKKFEDFIKEKELMELAKPVSGLNRSALDYDKKLAQFNSRFSDPKEAEETLKNSGYDSVAAFVADPDEKKWSRLRIPGQGNYVKK